jgi:hypothetical protein
MKKRAGSKKYLTKNRHPDYYTDKTTKRCRPRKCGILRDEGVQREIGRLFFFRAIVLIKKSCPPTARGEEEDEGVRGEKTGPLLLLPRQGRGRRNHFSQGGR